MQKQLEGTQSILMSSADRVATYRWATHTNIIEQYTRALTEYKYLKCRRAIHLRMFATGFCFNNGSAPPQILAASTVFSSAQFRNEEMMGDSSLVLLLPVCFEQ